MSTKYVDETCRQKSFRPNYVDKMSSTKYAVDLSAVDEVSIDKMSVEKFLSTIFGRQYFCRIDISSTDSWSKLFYRQIFVEKNAHE